MPERIIGNVPFATPDPARKIIYWMQRSIRQRDNLALALASSLSRASGRSLEVVFHADPHQSGMNYRQAVFLAEGIRDVSGRFRKKGVPFRILSGPAETLAGYLAANAACVLTERAYLAPDRERLAFIRNHIPVSLTETEDNLIVPVESASHHAEWAARTIRPRLLSKTGYFTGLPIPDITVLAENDDPGVWTNNDKLLDEFLRIRKSADYIMPGKLKGGESEASRLLDRFIADKLATYADDRNHPERQGTSLLSAYLRAGMISPLTIYDRVKDLPGAEPFVEQLLVRRELAYNHIFFTPEYDRYDSLPAWSRQTLGAHLADPRPFLYEAAELEAARTHDECWNAAMREMLTTGYMENTMRMYWGKKVIEWSRTPREAFDLLLYLNNRYFLDGNDPNSFVGVGWCFGLHDRPWGERPVFGTVRYMNEAGLRRKYDMPRYIARF